MNVLGVTIYFGYSSKISKVYLLIKMKLMLDIVNWTKNPWLDRLWVLGEPTVNILLNEHNVKLLFKCLSLYPCISASLNLDKRSFFLQYMEINTETYN